MARLPISVALTTNLHTRPILEGEVTAEGVAMYCTPLHASELFWRQLKFQEFDVSEMSMSSLLISVANGDRTWVGLPVFTSRKFFHTAILIRSDRGIREPQDLKGRRIGVPEYQQTAALWVRGALQHEFGVRPEDLHWHMERTPERSHGGATGFTPPPDVKFDYIPEATNIGQMMLAGELDAAALYIVDRNLVDRSTANLAESDDVEPLFADRRSEVQRYFRSTGIFPVNHCVVIRRTLAEEHPWLVLNVYKAFREAKVAALRSLRTALTQMDQSGLYPEHPVQEAGFDSSPYGVTGQRALLETLTAYSHEQGLTPREVPLDEVFHPATMTL
jgi:4,5-dihydroxyphthalate decarboxylase